MKITETESKSQRNKPQENVKKTQTYKNQTDTQPKNHTKKTKRIPKQHKSHPMTQKYSKNWKNNKLSHRHAPRTANDVLVPGCGMSS